MGIEEYANKKLKDYEKRVEEETRKKKEIERDNYELNNKAVENEDKLRELLRQVQIQKEKKKAIDELMERKTKKMEA